ncbi:MAG: DNA-binding protein [Cyanobium sp. NAT70]|nr:DNA-binding protein [Cyanobium sp. NAT70]
MTQRAILRRCVACRQLLDRSLLWRVVRDHKDGVLLDKGMGRSAYLCTKETCMEEALRRKRLQKALRCQVPDSILAELQERVCREADESAEAN